MVLSLLRVRVALCCSTLCGLTRARAGVSQFGPHGKCHTKEECQKNCPNSFNTDGKDDGVWYCCDEDAQCTSVYDSRFDQNGKPGLRSCACNSVEVDDVMCNFLVHSPQDHVPYFFSRIVGSSGCV